MTILLAGCVRAASSVDPKPAPSFELQVINSRPCPTATDPQLACFVVKIHNRGNKDGMGWEGKGREGKGREGKGPVWFTTTRVVARRWSARARPSRLVYDQARRCARRARRT